ncbi:hypothetical protein [Bacillus suaedae]|uniref:Uncharacterized protein n=1 Tax=Halalkalibacter suaedae TaxID=2822140 RepID=A0A940WT56_9BACI|nr:hypothetical protein [Bacillus suaedae]MBP3950177.1 hypothetical protein [Bacillus suaedae]
MSRALKWITGLSEAVLGIPIVGAAIVIGNGWMPLGIMLILHIITLFVTKGVGGRTRGSILGIITSCLAWIPFVGMIMHTVTAVFLLFDAFRRR